MGINTLCKGGCGNKSQYKGWCDIKWKKGNRMCVTCPELEKRRAESISRYRIKEAKLGMNPMQNPKICKKNHSQERNKKASETLKRLGKLGLLPQQTESTKLREKRHKKIREKISQMAKLGQLNHQKESKRKKSLRHKKISKTLKEKIAKGIIKIVPARKVLYNSANNGLFFLRSGWEHEVAKFLDINSLKWEYESVIIPYFNHREKEICNTIPDFFIPKYNLFIEVKSSNPQIFKNAKDKIEGIRNAGFNTLLWMDKEINLIRKGEHNVLIEEIHKFGVRKYA